MEITIHTGLGYIAVEFFLIVSGYLLFQSLNNRITPYKKWVIHRYIFLWTQYIFLWILLSLYCVMIRKDVQLIELLRDYLPEALMIQMTGMGRHLNSALWFVSAMFLVSCIIYFVASNHYESFTNIIAPSFVLIIYSYFYQRNKGLHGIAWGNTFIVSDGIFRALAGLCVGGLAYEISKNIKQYYARFKLIRALYEIVFIVISLVRFYGRGCDPFDFTYILLAMIFVISIFGRKDHCDGSYLTQMLCKMKINGKYSYAIYCNHWLFTYIIKDFFPRYPFYSMLLLYLFVVTVFSIITQKIIDKAVNGLKGEVLHG